MAVYPTAPASPDSSMVIPSILVTPASSPSSPTTQPLIYPPSMPPKPSPTRSGLSKSGDVQFTSEPPVALSTTAVDPQDSFEIAQSIVCSPCTAGVFLNMPLPKPLPLSSVGAPSPTRLPHSKRNLVLSSPSGHTARLRRPCSVPPKKTISRSRPTDIQRTMSGTVCAPKEEPCTKNRTVIEHNSAINLELSLAPIPEVDSRTQSQQTPSQMVILPNQEPKSRLPLTKNHQWAPLTQKHWARDIHPHNPEKAQQALNRRLQVTKSLHDLNDSETSWKTLFTRDDDTHTIPRPISLEAIETCKQIPARPLRHKKAIANLREHIVMMEAEKKKRREEDTEKMSSVIETQGRRDDIENCLCCVVEGKVF